ncbi:MAG: RNA polymerase sporulation sigma factor SigE [Clostridia bacterium]|nr:RNA polymerase sporulation sigma factor SigE [Clostridia bacterium]
MKRYLIRLIEKIRCFIIKIRIRSSGIYYIGGADTLPPPLSAEEEADILERIEGSPKLRDTLIERNLRLVVYIAKKYESSGAGLEDLVSIGTIGLIKAVNTYRHDRNIKLATYASRCIENEILMHLRKTQRQKAEISIDEPLSTDWDGNELLLSDVLGGEEGSVGTAMEKEEERSQLLRAVEELPERERVIIKLRFGIPDGPERTQKEVADLLGISQSYISRLEKRIIDRLRQEITKN